MKTGSGIIHSEMPAMKEGKLHGFQLWINMPAKLNAKFLVISGKPINEEIARGGPFVMNTKAEILQAVQDYHNDTFVK